MRELVRDRERLEHIIDAIDRLLSAKERNILDNLKETDFLYYGVVKNIEIIGEAAYRLTKAFRDSHNESPWGDIIRMRHVLVHDYYRIKIKEVKKVINEDLEPLRSQIADYLMDTDWEEWEKNEKVVSEITVNKHNINTARLMLLKGYDVKDISEITGLSVEDIESL